MTSAIGGTGIIFEDDFNTNGPIDSTKWDYNRFENGGSFYGRTQQRQTLPSAQDGELQLRLDTFNPTGGPSFSTLLGSEAITKQLFGPASGSGIAFEAKARYAQDQAGIIGGFFTFAGPANNHDEIDFELLSNDLSKIQTNIYHNEPLYEGHPISYPVTGSLQDSHVYRIEWLPNVVRWLVDGVVVRTERTLVPDKAMAMHLNIWGPPASWPTGSDSLVAASSASQNQTFLYLVDYVKVEQLAARVGSPLSEALVAGEGDHWLDGAKGHDTIRGGAGDDTLAGGGGDDVVKGRKGADVVSGAAHDDRLFGEAGDDLLAGGTGDDALYGGRGADSLRGGAGDDVIVGGKGGDTVNGGQGADTFAYHSAGDAPAGAGPGARETIVDFHPGFGDLIDLSRIDAGAAEGDQAFRFIGTRGFTGSEDDPAERGEVGYDDVRGGILVRADADGDGIADLEIFVAGVSTIGAAEFVL